MTWINLICFIEISIKIKEKVLEVIPISIISTDL